MFLEIHFAQETAVLLHEVVDLVRDLAFVKNIATFLTDQSQRSRQRWIFENFAFGRRPAFTVEHVSFEERAGKSFIESRTERPVIRDEFRDWKTFLSITNRRREIVAKFQLPEFFMKLRPGVDATGHADRQHSLRWNRFAI